MTQIATPQNSTALYDSEYNYLPWGSLERIRHADFIAESVLPPWLSIYDNAGGQSNYALLPYASSTQGLRVDTPINSGNYSVININDNRGAPTSAGGSFRNDLMEIRIAIDGLTTTHNNTLMDFGINMVNGNNKGCRVACTSAGTFFEARGSAGTTTVQIPYYILQGGENAKPRNIEFISRPDRWVLLRENGYEVAKWQFTAAQLGQGEVQPKPVIFNRGTGTVRSMFLEQLHLTICT